MSNDTTILAIDKLAPIIDMFTALSVALECQSFDESSIRQGICNALDMGTQELVNISTLLEQDLKKGA